MACAKHCFLMYSDYMCTVTHLILPQPYKIGSAIAPILHMRKLRHRELVSGWDSAPTVSPYDVSSRLGHAAFSVKGISEWSICQNSKSQTCRFCVQSEPSRGGGSSDRPARNSGTRVCQHPAAPSPQRKTPRFSVS